MSRLNASLEEHVISSTHDSPACSIMHAYTLARTVEMSPFTGLRNTTALLRDGTKKDVPRAVCRATERILNSIRIFKTLRMPTILLDTPIHMRHGISIT